MRVRRPFAGRRWLLLPAAGSLAAILVALVVVFGASGDSARIDGILRRGAEHIAVGRQRGGEPRRARRGRGLGRRRQRRRRAPPPTAGRRAGTGAAPERAPATTAIAPSPPPPSPNAVAPARTRKVERSAVLALRTPDDEFERTTDAVIATVARFDGIVASSQIGASDAAGGEASFDLRIPTERLDRALAALSKLGHVTERSQSLQDITASLRLGAGAPDRRPRRAPRPAARARPRDDAEPDRRHQGAAAHRLGPDRRDQGRAVLAAPPRRPVARRSHRPRRRREREHGRRRSWTPGRRGRRRAARARGAGGRRTRRAGGARAARRCSARRVALAVRAGRRRRRESALDPA